MDKAVVVLLAQSQQEIGTAWSIEDGGHSSIEFSQHG
jgi:hypothetical protein